MRLLGKYAKALIVIALVLAMFSISSINAFADTAGWQSVGSAGFSAGAVDYTSIAVDSSGTPYITHIRMVETPIKRQR